MKEYTNEEILMLSGIQHFIFCRRQWALIHLENQWQENLKTTEGMLMHEKCGDIFIMRGLRFTSLSLGVSGQCDVVEFYKRRDNRGAILYGKSGSWDICPIEYKRGRNKYGDEDISQLCGQALCLEEMFACKIDYGYLYYGETRKRQKVIFTNELREQVKTMINEMHEYYRRGYTNISVTAYYKKNLGADE